MKQSLGRIFLLLAAATLAAGSSALLSGCKGNTTAASTGGDPLLGPIPTVVSRPADSTLANDSPLTSTIWKNAAWLELDHPANSTKRTPPTKTAVLHDAERLYVAFLCDRKTAGTDFITLLVDLNGNGMEYVELTLDPAGELATTWYKASAPLTPREDGSPNPAQPYMSYPDLKLPGIRAQAWSTPDNSTWAAVFSLPRKGLTGGPGSPLRIATSTSSILKINALRTTQSPTAPDEFVQSNLSRVYQAAQAISPYRMAPIQFAE